MGRKLSVVRSVWIGLLTFMLFSIITLTAVWLYEETGEFHNSNDELRIHQYDYDKDILINEVNGVLGYIDYSKSRIASRLRYIVQQRTLEAYAVADHLYKEGQADHSPAVMQSMVVEALRPIRYHNDRGYFFITALDGTNLLLADRPEVEGSNLLESSNQNMVKVVSDMIELSRSKGEGFYEYRWTKPGVEGDDHLKIAYIKYFEPLDAYIGTGEYFSNLEADIKAEVLDRLDTIAFVDGGYVFAGSFDGISLSGPTKGRNMIDIEDSNGVKIVQELVKQAQAGGGFVEYVMPPLEAGLESAPKLSYTVGVEEWDWYVGAGKYVSDIDSVINQRTEQYRRNLLLNLWIIIGLSLLLTGVISMLTMGFRNHISECFRSLADYFKEAKKGVPDLDPKKMRYAEFDHLAAEANRLVAEREAIQRELIKSKENYQQLVDTMEEGLILVDQFDNIVYYNNSAARILGVKSDELSGQNLCSFTDEEGCTLITQKTGDRRRGETDCYEMTIIQPGGNHRRIQISVCPQFNENNEFTGSLGTFHDVTDQHILEQRIRQSQKMEAIGTLAGGIAHDFNNILFAILGYAHMIKDSIDSKGINAEYANEIVSAANRAADLVRQILSFAKQTKSTPTAVNLSVVITEVLRLMRATVPANITLRDTLETRDAIVAGDPGQIHQVLMNLCTNAYQSMPDGGELAIAVRHREIHLEQMEELDLVSPGSYIELKVSDTGHGMEQAVLDRIFDPFFSTKETGDGTGLGLSVVHGIVTGMNGSITATSCPGSGSEFTLLLPEGELATGGVVSEDDEEDYSGSGKILIVDDELSIAKLLGRMLESHGFTTETFTDSGEAMAAYVDPGNHFDLVITDQDMPGMTGGSLACRILEHDPQAKIILCTGYSNVLQREDALLMGIKDYLIKPVKRSDMLRAIRGALHPPEKTPPAPS